MQLPMCDFMRNGEALTSVALVAVNPDNGTIARADDSSLVSRQSGTLYFRAQREGYCFKVDLIRSHYAEVMQEIFGGKGVGHESMSVVEMAPRASQSLRI